MNVDFDVYRDPTEITEKGSTIEAGIVDQLPRPARPGSVRWEQARRGPRLRRPRSSGPRGRRQGPDPHRRPAPSSDKLFTEIFPGRTEVPKTLIFAKDDAHADDIVQIVREEFGKGNDFCQQDHLPDHRGEARGPARRLPQHLQPADRRDRRHDRHRHRRQAARVRVLHARGQVAHLLRADEGPRRPRSINDDRPSRPSRPTPRRRTHFVIVDAVGVTETELERHPAARAASPRCRSTS